MAVRYCPNCDGILNAIGCQSCGWKHGDPSARNLVINPFKPDREYGKSGTWAEPAAIAAPPKTPPTVEASKSKPMVQ